MKKYIVLAILVMLATAVAVSVPFTISIISKNREINRLTTRNNLLESNALLPAEIAAHQAQIAALLEQIGILEGNITTLRETKAQLEKDNEELNLGKVVEELREEIKDLKQDIIDLETEHTADLTALQNQLDIANASIAFVLAYLNIQNGQTIAHINGIVGKNGTRTYVHTNLGPLGDVTTEIYEWTHDTFKITVTLINNSSTSKNLDS